MKITPAHYAHMKFEIGKTPANDVRAQYARIIREGKAQDVAKRLRWDMAYRANLTTWFCEEVYPYANDTHIDTALRQIMRELYGV